MLAATDIRLDRVALLIGLAAATVLLLSWRVEGGTVPPAAEVTLITRPSADLAITPEGVTSETGRVRANDTGAELARELGVRNATLGSVAVSVRAQASAPDLDDSLMVSVEAGDEHVFEGPLAALRQGSAPFTLATDEERTMVVRAWIAADAPAEAWRARAVDIELELVSGEAS